MSAPTKVNNDVQLLNLSSTAAASSSSDVLTLRVHDTLESMRAALESRRGSNPSEDLQLQRRTAFRIVNEADAAAAVQNHEGKK